jgi:hypothetical protein
MGSGERLMAQPAKGHEPSMEEILASIRRIIADEPKQVPFDEKPRTSAFHKEHAGNEGARVEGRVGERALGEAPREARSFRGSNPDYPPQTGPAEDAGYSHIASIVEPAEYLAPSDDSLDAAPAKAVTVQEDMDAILAELQARSRPIGEPVQNPPADILELTEETGAAEVFEPFDVAAADEPGPFEEEEEPRKAQPPRSAAASSAGADDHHISDPERAVAPPAPSPNSREDTDRLISAATTAAVDSAFNTLAQTVLVQNGRTLEDLVREMLRPMLKSWLDDNLPNMVERLVRAEIERVSRGRG